MTHAIFLLTFGGILCLLCAVGGGLFELWLWIDKALKARRVKPDDTASSAGTLRAPAAIEADAMAKALAELITAFASAPAWIAMFGAAMFMLFSAKWLAL
jgi:hypothetical protein